MSPQTRHTIPFAILVVAGTAQAATDTCEPTRDGAGDVVEVLTDLVPPALYTYETIDWAGCGVRVDYPQIAIPLDGAEAFNRQLEEFVTHEAQRFCDMPVESPERPNGLTIKGHVQHVSDRVVSIELQGYGYTGGAHGWAVREGINVDLRTGKRITLGELIQGEAAQAWLVDTVYAQLKARGASGVESGWVTKETLAGVLADDPRYVVTGAGLKVIFPEYTVGSYAEGTYEVSLPFLWLEDKLDPNGPLSRNATYYGPYAVGGAN